MPRSLSAAVLAAIAQGTVYLTVFAELAFADNTLYVFSGVGSFTPAGPPANPASTFPYGQTFTGLGQMGKISEIPQTNKIQAQNIVLGLSGIPANLVAEAVSQVRIAGTATLWLGFFDANGNLLTDPVQIFSGAMDVPTLTDSGETCDISITCENPLISLNLAPNRRFDDPDQQIYFPGDLGFSFVEALTNLQLFWPAPDNVASPYPLFATVTPGNIDVAVGGTTAISVTVHYSDGSTKTLPGGSGSGPTFILGMASSNPKIAKFDYSYTVTGVSPGECGIMARGTYQSSGVPTGQWRQVATIFVRG